MNQFDKLIKLVKKGDIQKVSQILQQATLNINELDPKSGKSLLHISMQTQSDQIFTLLIGYPGIDVQKPSKQGQLPLQTAIILNNYFYVQKILSTGNINPKRKNINQETVLQIAIKNQTSPQIIKKLIQYKFDINQPVNQHGNLINLAIANKQKQNLLFLLNYGTQKGQKKDSIKINTLDSNDNTCLSLAVQMNLGDAVVSIFDYLSSENCSLSQLQKQFFINTQNKQGNTALHIACIKNHQTIMSIIQTRGKQFGIDTNLKNKKGQTCQQIKQQTQRQRILQKQLKQKNQQQKRIYLKQKQEQKQRRRQQQERQRLEQKRKKKQEQLFLLKQQQYEKQLKTNKAKWMCGIAIIVIIALMYLAILNTIQTKKKTQL